MLQLTLRITRGLSLSFFVACVPFTPSYADNLSRIPATGANCTELVNDVIPNMSSESNLRSMDEMFGDVLDNGSGGIECRRATEGRSKFENDPVRFSTRPATRYGLEYVFAWAYLCAADLCSGLMSSGSPRTSEEGTASSDEYANQEYQVENHDPVYRNYNVPYDPGFRSQGGTCECDVYIEAPEYCPHFGNDWNAREACRKRNGAWLDNCHESLARTCDSRSFVTHRKADLPGGDFATVRDATLDACAAACSREADCKAFTFDHWNRICFLKSYVGTLRLEPRSTTGVLVSETADEDTRMPVIQKRRQKGFPDDQYSAYGPVDYDQCAGICLDDPQCGGFNYREATGACLLIEDPSEYGDSAMYDLGIKIQPP